MRTHGLGFGIATVAAAVSLSACSHQIEGHPVASGEVVPSQPQTTLSQGSPPASPRPTVPINPDTMSTSEMVQQMVYETVGYWNEHGVAREMPELVEGTSCASGVTDTIAVSCKGGSLIVYSLSATQRLRDTIGNLAVFELFAHEVGHGLSGALGISDDVSQNTKELRADCASGAATSAQAKVTLARAVEVFNRTEMYNADMEPTKAFTAGFNAGRNGGDVVQVCTTYAD